MHMTLTKEKSMKCFKKKFVYLAFIKQNDKKTSSDTIC